MQSEYATSNAERRHFISRFTGSAGTAVVTSDAAALWTDGRYFLQVVIPPPACESLLRGKCGNLWVWKEMQPACKDMAATPCFSCLQRNHTLIAIVRPCIGLQASQQLGPAWTLMRAGTPSCPEIPDWLAETLPQSAAVGIDPYLHTVCLLLSTRPQ